MHLKSLPKLSTSSSEEFRVSFPTLQVSLEFGCCCCHCLKVFGKLTVGSLYTSVHLGNWLCTSPVLLAEKAWNSAFIQIHSSRFSPGPSGGPGDSTSFMAGWESQEGKRSLPASATTSIRPDLGNSNKIPTLYLFHASSKPLLVSH